MTTDTKPLAPTDAELNELADACTPNTETGSLNYRKFARAVLAKWGTLRAEKIVIPTDTMEQEFQKHYQRGYAAGQKASATQPTQAQAVQGVQWQCGPQASGFTAPQADPLQPVVALQEIAGMYADDFTPQAYSHPARDERDDFEKVFPLPSGCIRVGTGYASTGYSNWAAHTHVERWEGWQARADRAPADSVLEDAARLEALHAAVTAIYLDDSSDFKSALGAVVRHLDHKLAGDLLAWPKRAYDISLARLDAARKQGVNHD